MTKFNVLIDKLQAKIPNFNAARQEISNANVGWHIEHTLLTLNRITDELIKSNPKDYKWKFNLIRIIVMTTEKIPRGRGRSPKVVLPEGRITIDSLEEHIQITRQKIAKLENIQPDRFFEHPFFGNLKLNDTIKFLEIHTKHHLEIIEDILK